MREDSWWTVVVAFLRRNLLQWLTGVIVWGTLGWLLSDDYLAVVGRGGATVLLVVCCGAAVGAVGSLACGVWAGVAMVWYGVPVTAVLWFVVPLVVVFLIVQVCLAMVISDRRTAQLVFVVSGRSTWEWHVRTVRSVGVAGYVVLLVPFGVWLAQPQVALLEIVFIAAVLHIEFLWLSRNLSPYRRAETQVATVAWMLFCLLLAASPTGTSFVDRWHAVTSDGVVVAVLWYTAVVVLLALLVRGVTRLYERALRGLDARPQLRLRRTFSSVYGALLFPAWFGGFSLLLAPDERGIGAFTMGMLVQAVLLLGWRAVPLSRLQRLDASVHMRYAADGDREIARHSWLVDCLRDDRRKPSIPLVKALIEAGRQITVGRFIPPPPERWDAFVSGTARPVELAAMWFDEATQLLNLLARVQPDVARRHREYYPRRIECLAAMGEAYALHGFLEEGQRAFAKAAELCRRANMPHMRVGLLMRSWAAGVAMGDGDLTGLDGALQDPRVVPAVRARIMIDVGTWLAASGDRAGLEAFLERTSAVAYHPDSSAPERIQRVGSRVLIDVSGTRLQFRVGKHDEDVFRRGLAYFEEVTEGAEFRPFLTDVLSRFVAVPGAANIRAGMAWIDEGRNAQGGAILVEAAHNAAARGMNALAIELFEVGARALRGIDWRMALGSLCQAVDLRDLHRRELIDEAHRRAFSAAAEPLYEDGVRLLVTEAEDPVAAFDLMEQARSRELVALLGEKVPRPEMDGLTELTALMRRFERLNERAIRSRTELGEALLHRHLLDPNSPPFVDEEPGLQWVNAVDDAARAEAVVREWEGRRLARGEPPEDGYLTHMLALDAVIDDRLQAASTGRREPVDRAHALRTRRVARDEQLVVWHRLSERGGKAAEYVTLRAGNPITFHEVRDLIAENHSAGQNP